MAQFLPTWGLSERYCPGLKHNCMGGFLHLQPTAGCQISTSIKFKKEIVFWEGVSLNIPLKIPDGTVIAHLVIKSKVLSRPLTDLGAWVGLCTSTPPQGVKCQLRLKQKIWWWCGGVSLNIPW